MEHVAIAILLFFLIPLLLNFAAKAYLNYEEARFMGALRDYITYCQENDIIIDPYLIGIRKGSEIL